MKEEISTLAAVNVCIIWDDKKYPVDLFGNCQQPVFSQASIFTTNFKQFDLIYILVELKWHEIQRIRFHGFQVAKILRKEKKVLCPLVFCSFLKEFDAEKHPESKILNTPGHYLLQLPDKPLALNNYKGIDEDTLEDINISLFDRDQHFHDLIHNTVNRCVDIARNFPDKDLIKSNVLAYLSKQLDIFRIPIQKDNLDKYERLKADLFCDLEKIIYDSEFDPEELRNPIKDYREQFYRLLPFDLSEGIEDQSTPKRWQVVFVDDQPGGFESIVKHFARNGIICHPAKTAEEAFEILSKDEKGAKRISVIITDFRFYVNGDEDAGKWQDLQGYSILNQIHSDKKFISHYGYVMLTSKTGTIQQQIKKQSKFPILWFNKADVLGGKSASFNVFCQRIIEVGSDAFFRKHYIPNTAVWKKGLAGRIDFGYYYFYKQHIESLDYDENEQEINRLALKNIHHAKSENELSATIDIQISLLYKAKHGKTEVSYNTSELLTKFRQSILVARRIYWGLSFFLSMDKSEIFGLFKKGYLQNSDNKNPKSMESAIINTSLGISSHTMPSAENQDFLSKYDLLVEEHEFLKKNAAIFKAADIVSLIGKGDKNFEVLATFFEYIAKLEEIPEAFAINKKLDERKRSITTKEFENCLAKIKKKKESDFAFPEKFRRATEQFYRCDIDEISSELSNKLLKLKHW